MSWWSKLVLGFKWTFCGFESAAGYLLELLNKFLGKEDAVKRIQKAREYVSMVLSYMYEYRGYCPSVWMDQYMKLITAVQTLNNALADNKVTQEELDKAIADVKAAIDAWFKD